MVISMERWRGKVALVTGASAGIGAAIASQLVHEGMKVVGVARRKEKLDELHKSLKGKPGSFYPIPCDVAKEDEILRVFEWIEKNLGPIHILVNNAGVFKKSTLMEGTTQDWKQTIDVNIMAVCIFTREAIKNMKKNHVQGHIANINSLAGHRVANIPGLNVYPATKHAVTAITETLRQELVNAGEKIKVTSISPGLVRTDMPQGLGFDLGKIGGVLEVGDVADAVVYALATPPHVQIHELMIRPVGQKL